MSLTERSRKDMQTITSKATDFAVPATFTDLAGEIAEVNVLHTKHNTAYTPEGVETNVRISSIAVANEKIEEANLIYSYTNAKNDVTYLGHSVTVADASGITRSYVVRENYPDETLGMTVLILAQKD
jgi:hypothetical protein